VARYEYALNESKAQITLEAFNAADEPIATVTIGPQFPGKLVHNGSFLAQYQASGGAQAQWEYAVAAGDRHFEQTSRGTREILVFRMRSKNGISIIG
jgi:hypothetical protein